MNNSTVFGICAVVAIAAAGSAAVAQVGSTEALSPIGCSTLVCSIPVTVKRQGTSTRCQVAVSSQASVTGTVQTIVWSIRSADFRFDSVNGVKIRNDAGDFDLLPSASGQEFKLKFVGQGHHRTYEYELNIVSVGDGKSCQGPGGGLPTLPRIKNE